MPETVLKLADLTPETCPARVRWPDYNRDKVEVGVVHVGVGGFHRAHQARYLDDYMSGTGDLGWGICGIGLMPGDKTLIDSLARQDGLYSLTEKDDRGDHSRIVGSLTRVIFAPEQVDEAIDAMADPRVRIISMTITEGGYRFDFEKNRFFSDHPDIQHDLAQPHNPRTLFGYLWQACRRRALMGASGRVTLLSCDNVPHNGDVLRQALLAFIDLAEPALRPWFEQAVTFPNSMVDRITPAPGKVDRDYVRQRYRLDDACAVGSETFIQWVIEDSFAAGRPALERQGVQFTGDVAPYEMTKLRLLNGSHLMMGFVGYLAGYKRVDLAIRDPSIRQLVEDYMRLDAEPTLPAIDDVPVRDYEATLVERFANSRIADQQLRICCDGYAKLKNYVMPVVWDLIDSRADTRRLSFMFACFLAYLNGEADDGSKLDILEFNLSDEQNLATRHDRLSLLRTDALFGRSPSVTGAAFLDEVGSWYERIIDQGAHKTLEQLLEGVY